MCSLFINPLITIGSNFINCIWSWKEWIWECIISSDWIYYHRCNEQGVQKNNISQHTNRWFLLKCKCVWPTREFILVSCPRIVYICQMSPERRKTYMGSRKSWQTIFYSNNVTSLTSSSLEREPEREMRDVSWSQFDRSQQKWKYKCLQKHKSRLPLLGSGGLSLYPLSSVTLCIRYPEWLSAVTDAYN